MDWKEKIAAGLNLIIEGCKENSMWTHCHDCPFDALCTSICRDEEHRFSVPECYEEEGYFQEDDNPCFEPGCPTIDMFELNP